MLEPLAGDDKAEWVTLDVEGPHHARGTFRVSSALALRDLIDMVGADMGMVDPCKLVESGPKPRDLQPSSETLAEAGLAGRGTSQLQLRVMPR